MLVSPYGNPLPLGIEYPDFTILNGGISYTFESKVELESLKAAGSTAVTIDIVTRLFREMVEFKQLLVNPLSIQITELRNWEIIIEKLNALDAVSGMLNELNNEQLEIFEASVKRRPLFK